MSKSPKIDPSLVQKPEVAEEYNRLHDNVHDPSLNKHKCSDGNYVSLLDLKHRLKEKVQHLGKEEIEDILERWNEFHKMTRKMGILKRQVFKGTKTTEGVSTRDLLEPAKAELLEWFGRLYSEEEIQKKLVDKGLPVSITAIRRFKSKYKADIERLQHEYEMDWRAVPITRKRSRLDQLSYIYNQVKQSFDSANGSSQLPYSKEMRAVLEQVRKEVEGDNIKLTVDGRIDVNTTIEINKTTEQLYSQINFMSLLIGRVSARFKVDPAVLHHQLMNSWYSEYTGVKRNDKFKELTPEYPSSIVYNWDVIKEKHENKEKFYEKMSKNGDIQDVEEIKKNGEGKEMLRELMKKKIKSLDERKEKF